MNMIRKLRHQFIFLATIAVFIIVTGALGLINIIGYFSVRSDIMDTLTYISQNDGHLPRGEHPVDNSWFPIMSWTDDTPEFAYQTRYFSIHINANEEITDINVKNIAAFSEEEAVKYARATLNTDADRGFLLKDRARYGFMKTTAADGSRLIVVMDCTREFGAVKTFMNYSLWFGFICIILYVMIFAFLSKRAIEPFVRNFENQKRFITNASHELKTPIAIISVNAEALEIMQGKNQWTEGIRKQVKRLSNLINHLILLSKASEGSGISFKKDNVSISKVLKQLADEFRPLAEDKGKTLVDKAPDNITAVTDEKYITELINIFIDNAIKYADDKGEIELNARPVSKGRVQITVTNPYKDGKDVDYSRFFERFYRNDESHNSQKSGYGIGLSIASELIESMGGTLKVFYKDGKITFSIFIG